MIESAKKRTIPMFDAPLMGEQRDRTRDAAERIIDGPPLTAVVVHRHGFANARHLHLRGASKTLCEFELGKLVDAAGAVPNCQACWSEASRIRGRIERRRR